MPFELTFDLTTLWAAIIAVAVFAYVVLDGFDLGAGMLFALFPKKRDRDTIMNSVAPVWDGNETWLVLGGGGLFAAFPLAYAVIMPAVYAPLIAMLLALVFRGVSFEFRWRTERGRFLWDWGFMTGSAVAAFCQGVILGAILQGIPMADRAYAGGWWNWLSPFTVLAGVSVAIGYLLLGATWLVAKTEGELQARARRLAWVFFILVVACMGAVSLWTPFLEQNYFDRWFRWPGLIAAILVPLATAAIAWAMHRALKVRPRDIAPFVLSLALFGLAYAGLALSMYPWLVPGVLTLNEAAAPRSSQLFMLPGVLILLPVILGYTGYAYWVFRGKVGHDAGYH